MSLRKGAASEVRKPNAPDDVAEQSAYGAQRADRRPPRAGLVLQQRHAGLAGLPVVQIKRE